MFNPQYPAEPRMFDPQYPGECSDLANYKERVKKNPILEWRSTVLLLLLLCMSHLGYPPWILKRGGLESSGQKPISSFGETKKIAFFSANFFHS